MGDIEVELVANIAHATRQRRPWMVERLAEITALDGPSGSPDGLDAAASLLVSWLDELGAATSVRPTSAGPLIDASFAGHGYDDAVLVLCHYDTVWPIGTAAERPFQLDGKIARGPGVLDMRGGIVACLGAIAVLTELGPKRRPVRLLVTPDEETGSEASRAAIVAAAREATLVLVPEPALPDGSLKTARKGWLLLRLVAHGVAAHAGLEPERGASAVDELVTALGALYRLREGMTTVNVGLLGSANPANVVADRAEATVDVRFGDGVEERRVRDALASLRTCDPRTRLEWPELHSRPPLVRTAAGTAAAARVRELAAQLGLAEIGEGAAGGVSDANLAATAAVPVLDGIGPVGGGAHALEEWVDVDSLVDRSALIALLLADRPCTRSVTASSPATGGSGG
ncbi:MAG: M20/M25/M40 family metallo-hydrolase [Solirubrobacterales bacterium]